MIAELLLVLIGHDSSIFQNSKINPAFAQLLHPGEQHVLESLAELAVRYQKIRSFCQSYPTNNNNRYVAVVCSTILFILTTEYESLVVETEAKILKGDIAYVSRGASIAVSSIRAIFSEWDAPMKALELFIDRLEQKPSWPPGPLIDLIMDRTDSGIQTVSNIFSKIFLAIQKLWSSDLTAFLVYGTVSDNLPLIIEKSPSVFVFQEASMPCCVSEHIKSSIIHIGRSVTAVKRVPNAKQIPRDMSMEHTKLIGNLSLQDIHQFEDGINQIKNTISEWLWINILTKEDVEETLESLANYFLMRNGEFGVSLIREFERLKLSRLISRPVTQQSQVIREQDLHRAVLRASLGTSAQHDPTFSRLRFILPSGPLRPLLPTLLPSKSQTSQRTSMDDMLIGTQLVLSYLLPWPLDLFLTSSALSSYNGLFAYLSTLRKTHIRILETWVSLSNSQRARRRWTGTGEGGTEEDQPLRNSLARRAWGCARTMNWFLEILMEYTWSDVIDEEYSSLKTQLTKFRSVNNRNRESTESNSVHDHVTIGQLDFNTLRVLHNIYLGNLLNNSLVGQPILMTTLRNVFETCELFIAQVERWGGDVLPPLLSEGRLGDLKGIGDMVIERWEIVKEINEKLIDELEMFYEQLLALISQPFTIAGDASMRSFLNVTSLTLQSFVRTKGLKGEFSNSSEETRRHVERLLLRLDFNGKFSNLRGKETSKTQDILKEGGILS
ncbi:hypothetical protein Clacol_003772 [Clathrus columnatus]|uniref:Spindle pole body component n=1 Tax=Clathrus columnatus TaxID=1419009 RepID=A0AAV5A9Z2_9AGAM|nr:hypothetical protein Clacol_003772 [Clathrus columnatus]